MSPGYIFGLLAIASGAAAVASACSVGWGVGDALFAPSRSIEERRGVKRLKLSGFALLLSFAAMVVFGVLWNEYYLQSAMLLPAPPPTDGEVK